MKKARYVIPVALLVVIAVWCFQAAPRRSRTIQVLFVGNSLTSANNLPGMVADIARSNGCRMINDAYAPGGARLANHASDKRALERLKEKPWDFVVFQEQSQYPGFSVKQLERDVFPHARKLCKAARSANPQTRVVFYMTMAHRDGDEHNRHLLPELGTYDGMQESVNWCYREMGEANHARVAPVGEVWMAVRREKPDLDLYADKVHPNRTGTYLAACVFNAVLFGKAASGSHVPDGVDRASARYIQGIVDRMVLEK